MFRVLRTSQNCSKERKDIKLIFNRLHLWCVVSANNHQKLVSKNDVGILFAMFDEF